MAKTKSTTPTTVSIVNTPLASIVASKSNPRKTFEKENIKDLADSMASVGLLQPIILRSLGDKFQIVAGERRYRAAKLLKWESVPAMVRNITDEEMLEIQIIENLQRENVSPLDEAAAFKTLLQKESLDWLCSRIHKSKKYISDRLKLNELIPEAADLVQKGTLPLGHAVVISKLSFADQKSCIDKCITTDWSKDDEFDSRYCSMPIEKLKDFIADEIMLDFDKVSFDPTDANLYPTAGACTNCLKRTCNSQLLFADITSDDKCTDAACFNEKINLHVERAKEKAKEQYGKVLSGEKSPYSSGHVKVQGVDVKYSEAPIKNGLPVVVTKADRWNKNHLGKTVYVDAKFLQKAKVDKDQSKKEKDSSDSWQARMKKEFTDVIWPRLKMISSTDIKPTDYIISEFFRERFSRISDRKTMSLAGILGYNGFAKDVDKAHESFQDEGYSFDFKKEMYNKIINSYETRELIVMLYLLDTVDQTEEDEAYIDRTDDYGFTWEELIKELGYTDPVKTIK